MGKQAYILMNKNTPVLECSFAKYSNELLVTDVFNLNFAPPVVNARSVDPSEGLSTWWARRGIPDSRIRKIEKSFGFEYDYPYQLKEVFNSLKLQSHALSLSDQYWLKAAHDNASWATVNFFTNPFDQKTGELIAGLSKGRESLIKAELELSQNPDFSTDGELPKWWSIGDDQMRYLNKGGRPILNQEPYNEVIATQLYSLILDKDDFVAYSLYDKEHRPFSRCANMIDENSEIVTAWALLKQKRLYPSDDHYSNLCAVYKELGIHDPELILSKMIVCDFIMANTDRHLNNLALVRDVETLEYLRATPLFDNGNSLYHNQEQVPSQQGTPYRARPFKQNPAEQLKLATRLDWLALDKLSDFTSIISDVLSVAENFTPTRIDGIIHATKAQIERLAQHREHSTPIVGSGL